MCGIGGYIGQSKNPKVTYELSTHLFKYLEIRGTDAAGFYGLGSYKNDSVIYHKEPGKSSNFIKTEPIWAKVQKFDPSILLLHARATSPNGGHAKNNQNNHPFVSTDKRIGLIHNGNIVEAEFLKNKYELATECDSEVLLRIYEAAIEENKKVNIASPEYVKLRMKGIQDIWSVVHKGAMAVAIAERLDEDSRCLFLFRNDKRPLWLADMREKLGQIFFFSSAEIWFRAIRDLDNKSLFENLKLVELPEKEVWFFYINKEEPIVCDENFEKFTIELRNTYKEWSADDYKKIQPKKVNIPVITDLKEDRKSLNPVSNKIIRIEKEEDDLVSVDLMEEVISKIDHLLIQISTRVTNAAIESSLTENMYQEVLDSLEQTKTELEGTFQLVKNY